MSVNIEDLVLLVEPNLLPQMWKLARVENVHPGTDGTVRVITAKTANGFVKRPISRVCRLPISEGRQPHN